MGYSKDQPDQPLRGSASEAVTNSVRVEVEAQYVPEKSQPFESEWVFAYTVRITNEGDETNFSHALIRPLPAEPLLDAVARVTGVPVEPNPCTGLPR